MGVAGIWDAIKGVQEPFTDSTDLKVDSKKVIIDGNNVLAIIWNVQGLGLEYFKCSTEAKVKEIAGFISNEILHFIETLVGGDRVVCLVFDGKDREIKKIEKNEKNEKKVKKKANAIRNIFKSQSGHIVGINTAILTNTIFPDGRLKYLILQGIASKLKVYQAKGEADFVIATLLKSQEWKGAAVMSMDSDYLVFTDCPVVINPIKKYRSVCYKDKVLEKLEINSEQLQKVAAYSGQDFIQGVTGYGFIRGLDVVKGLLKVPPKLRGEEKMALKMLKKVQELFANDAQFTEISEATPPPVHTCLLTLFLNEKKLVNNVPTYRRKGLKDFIENGSKPKTITSKPEWISHIRRQREKEAKIKVQRKTFTFHCNPNELIQHKVTVKTPMSTNPSSSRP